ncbi:MAG: hypothetical protein AAGJ38_01060 [Planctomycetota bacterium]
MNAPATAALPWPAEALGEPDLTTAAAARELSRRMGRSVSPSTVWRWAAEGRRGVHLPHARYGRTIRTSRRALDWFGSALAAAELREFTEHLSKRSGLAEDLDDLIEAEGL